MAFQSTRQRQAVMAQRRRQSNRPLLLPMSPKKDRALGFWFNPVGRAVRRVTERQYDPGERMIRRGTVRERLTDTAKQYGAEVGGSVVGAGAAFPLARRAYRGKGGLLAGAGVLYAGQLAGVTAAMIPVRRHVNRQRDVRLLRAGGQLKRRTGGAS